MRRVLTVAAAVVGGLLVVVAALFGYYIYTPLPKLPVLAGHALSATLDFDKHRRHYIQYAPAGLPQGSPLVIVLHGALMNGASMRRLMDEKFDVLADRRRFVVMYPDAYKGNWNDCRIAEKVPARLENIDDLGFVRALIAVAQAQLRIDPQKVFVVGFSNGGQMALTLATQSPSPIAAVAVFGSSLPTPDNSRCPGSTPTSRTMIVDGTADPLHPYGGGPASIFGFQPKGNVLSAPATAAILARRNGITAPPEQATLPHLDAADPTRIRSFIWSRQGTPYVALYEVRGGGHTLPVPGFRYPRIFGPTTKDIDGPAKAVAFFLQ